jgi:hypothetical protein
MKIEDVQVGMVIRHAYRGRIRITHPYNSCAETFAAIEIDSLTQPACHVALENLLEVMERPTPQIIL